MSFSSWLRNWKASLERRTALNQTLRRKSPAGLFTRRLFLETLEDRTLLSAAVTILGNDLMSARGLQEQYTISGSMGSGFGNRTVNLDPGTYSVVNDNGTFGTFTVSSQDTISGATGALVASGNNIDFDLTQLAAVTINNNLVTSSGFHELVNESGFGGYLYNEDTVYLPTGTYVLNNLEGGVYGTFTVADNGSGSFSVSGTTGALIAAGNTINFDQTQLAAITINNALVTSTGFSELVDEDGVGSYANYGHSLDTMYIPIGTYTLSNLDGGVYGTYTVADNGSGSFLISGTTGALVATGNTITIDPSKLAAITIDNNLITPGGKQELVNESGVGGYVQYSHNPDTMYIPTGTYYLNNIPGTVYGTFTVADNGSGAFFVSGTTGAAVANGNTIDFEHCALNSVLITPIPGVSWSLDGVTSSSEADTVLIPDGNYTISFSGATGGAGPVTFSVDANGLSDTELPAGSPLVSLKLTPCAPTLTSAAHVSNGTTIAGTYMGRANTTYQLNFYADTTATSSGQGQGETLLGSTTVTTDSNGNATFTASVAAPPPGETLLSATATDPNGNVSAFSQVICLPPSAQGTVYTVYTTADSGPGSLRQVILDANANSTGTAANPDEIVFCIPTTDPGYNSTTGAFTIQPQSALPTITDTLVLDGYTQPGASPNTLTIGDNAVLKIVLDGSKAGAVDGLVIDSGSSTVRGLVIDNFASGSGIVLTDGSNDIVVGDFIGTDVTGGVAAANSVGIVTNPNGPVLSIGERIGGTSPEDRNIISGNSNIGIDIDNGNLIEGNYIGTDKSGTSAVPNGTYNAGAGIYLASNNTVGGTAAGAGNVISGNASVGIHLVGNQNLVAANLIGTTASGLAALDNGTGIYITGNSNTIGGTTAGARNIISGNEGPGTPSNVGVNIDGQYGAGQFNVVEGNYIGTDITGTRSLYQGAGIFITGAYNTIGGTTAGARNIISGNGTGLRLFTSSYTGVPFDGFGNTVLGNYIGTDASGAQPLGGQFGIYVTAGAYDNTIGGTTSGVGNIIAFMSAAGVEVDSGTGNGILGNSIHDNGSLGIYLNSANNANNNQVAPVLTSVSTSSSATTISGTLQSTANTTFRVEFFSNAAMDPSGDGQGQIYLGFANVTTDVSGKASFTATFNTVVPEGEFISATATDPGGDTSEFSKDRVVGCFVVTNTNDSGPGSLREAIYDANTLADGTSANPDCIDFAIPTTDPGYNSTTGAFTIQPLSALPTITDTLVLDGYTQPGASPNTLGIGPLSQGQENGDGDNAVLRIELDGSLTGSGAVGLYLTGGSSTIEGLAINSFDVGISTSINGGDVIQGNFIGTNIIGTLAKGNVSLGIEVESNNNIIGGTTPAARNIVAGTENNFSTDVYGYGILIDDCTGNQVESNLIGVGASGTNSLANVGGIGIIDATDNTIGGATADARNIISGNGLYGVVIDHGAYQNLVEGNFIGTDVTGTMALGNSGNGVVIGVGANGNTVGGVSIRSNGRLAGAGNLISGNIGAGISQGSDGDQVYGNFIGTDVTGSRSLPNQIGGIRTAGLNNIIGGTGGLGNVISNDVYSAIGILVLPSGSGTVIQDNLIGTDATGTMVLGNGSSGIHDVAPETSILNNVVAGNNQTGPGDAQVIVDAGTPGTANVIVQGNYIGTDVTGSLALGGGGGGGGGIELDTAGGGVLVGGTSPGASNTIAFNGGYGVDVDFGTGDSILGNAIFSNVHQGIFLNTANHANNNQAAPVLTSVSTSGSGTTISGTLQSAASTAYRIEFFANAAMDPSGDGQGQTYLGFANVTTDASGNASFTATFNTVVPEGEFISATATDPGGDTSEFSKDRVVGCFVVTNTNDSGPGSLREAIYDANTLADGTSANPDCIDFAIPTTDPGYNSTTGAFTIQPLSALPTITDTLVLDGYTQPGASPNTLTIGDNAVLKIVLDGSKAGAVDGLVLGGGTVRGLVIDNFASGSGIVLNGSGNDIIVGNFIGTDVTGESAAANNIGINSNSSGDRIGGTSPGDRNIISGNNSTLPDSADGGGGPYDWGIAAGNAEVIEGNYIGTDKSGTSALGNGTGIIFGNNDTIGGLTATVGTGAGNLISGNVVFGIDRIGNQNLIAGNLIGTNATGLADLGNGAGIHINGNSNTIGGTTAGARDIISGNTGPGGAGYSNYAIDIENFGPVLAGGSYNVVEGDYIGTDITGTTSLGPQNAIIIFGAYNTIGGGTTGARNIISGNFNGIGFDSGNQLPFSPSNPCFGNAILGNYIGTDPTGMSAVPNRGYAIQLIQGTYDNTIGGSSPGEGNLISGNGAGIYLINETTGNLIQGNLIGTDRTGTAPLGNAGEAIAIFGGSPDNNTIGGTTVSAGNTIAFNHGNGVEVDGGTGNGILGNSIHDNSGLGIYLNSANNANNNQTAPVLTGGSATSSGTSVSGTLASVANTTFRIELFSNAGLDASGNAEGQTYLGFTTVTTDSTGHAAFSATNLAAIPAGQGYVTATATNLSTGDTSQFSNYLTAPTSTALTSSANPSSLTQPVTFTATVSSSFGTPTGSVDFFDTTTNTDLGTAALSSGGTASVTVSNLVLGSHVIKATYAGFGLFLGSSATLTQQVSYAFSFLPPLSNGLTFALNRTIPIKFQLTDANGNPITTLSAVSSLQVAAVVNGVAGTPFTPTSTNNQGLESVGHQYLYNWQTKGLTAGTYEIIVTLADGTTHTKTIQLTAGGSSTGLVTGSSGGTTTAGALLGGEVDLYVDNSNGDLTSDELARINDAVTSIDATIAPYGVTIVEVSDPTQANVILSMNTTSALGGAAQGVLGCTTNADQVAMIQGWSWYAGADPTQVSSGQYDFESAVMHELGHVLGLGHSNDSNSVMYASLAAGTANRTLVAADLNIPDDDSGPCALHAAPIATVSNRSNGQVVTAASSTSIPSGGSPLSVMDQLFANFALLLSDVRNAYQSELSSRSALWQSADALALQRLDVLLSLEAGAMGVSKGILMRDLVFASAFSSNDV